MQAGEPRDPQSLLDAFKKALALALDILRQSGVTEPSTLNLALSDGATTIVCRHASGDEKPLGLHLARGVRAQPGHPGALTIDGGAGGDGGGVVVASEPPFAHPRWEEVPPGHAVLVRPGAAVGPAVGLAVELAVGLAVDLARAFGGPAATMTRS
jgi:glutamine amidotransferase